MKRLLAAVAVLSGFFALTNAAIAADPAIESSGHAYFHLDGTYAFGKEGSGIQNGFDPAEAFQGDGVWITGYAGYVMPSGWDWRAGVGFADLSAGKTNGAGGNNDYGIDDAKMFNLDATVGYNYDLNGATLRPFLGLQYLEWKQDQGFHPDLPLGCCFMNSEFNGFGPKLGFEANAPLSDMFTIVGGADVSVLFGEIDYTAGTSSPASTGANSRTAFTASGFAGLDISLAESISFGVRYRLMYLEGTSYDNQNLFGTPSGKASNLLHGPSASLTIGF